MPVEVDRSPAKRKLDTAEMGLRSPSSASKVLLRFAKMSENAFAPTKGQYVVHVVVGKKSLLVFTSCKENDFHSHI